MLRSRHLLRNQCVVDYAAAWEANFVYDTIIFILTVAKTWQRRRGISGDRLSPAQLIFRDGRPCLLSPSLYLGLLTCFIHRCFILCVSLAFIPISMTNASKYLNNQV